MIKRKVQTVLLCRDANKQIQFLLLQTNKKRNSFWQNITGGVDDGEEFEHAALREAVEETGIKENQIISVRHTDMTVEFKDQWGFNVIEKIFILECDSPFEVKIDPQEHQDYKWISDQELSRECVKYDSNWQALQIARIGL